jgi:hypothetical protein
MGDMGKADGRLRTAAAWLLGIAILASLATACSEAGERQAAIQGVAGSAAAAGVSGGAGIAGMSVPSPGAGPGTQPSVAGASGSAAPQAGTAGGVGGASSSGNAGHAGSVADAGPDAAPDSGDSGGDDAGAMPGAMSVCMGGTVGMDSDSARPEPPTLAREYAAVRYLAAPSIEILSLKTTMRVPATPSSMQTLFVWPGLQSKAGAPDPARIGNGVLQPVLTWGPSCAPSAPRGQWYDAWWMAGMYVNVTTGAAGPSGCAGGDYMTTEVGDLLAIDMSVNGTEWTQTVTNGRTMTSVDFTIDLEGQVQNSAMWVIEVPSGETIRPSEDVVFTESVLTFASPVTTCQPTQAGTTDDFSAPILSPDGLHCCYETITLRAER